MNRADAPTFAVYHRWKAYVAIALLGLPLTVAAIAWPTVLTMVPIFAMGGLVLLGIYTDDPTPRAISEVSDPQWELYPPSVEVADGSSRASRCEAHSCLCPRWRTPLAEVGGSRP